MELLSARYTWCTGAEGDGEAQSPHVRVRASRARDVRARRTCTYVRTYTDTHAHGLHPRPSTSPAFACLCKQPPVQVQRVRSMNGTAQGVCRFGSAFHFQHHPNVIVAAVSDLDPEKRAELATACRCETTYESCESLIGDDTLEAVFIATDAPSHARLAIAALQAGKHVASAVPAVFGSLEDADALYTAYRASDRQYMMFETSYYHDDLYPHAGDVLLRGAG